MLIRVIWRLDGRLPWIRLIVFGWRLKIFLQRPVDRSRSSLDGDPLQNRDGFLVRADLPRQTHSAHTAVARLPGSISH